MMETVNTGIDHAAQSLEPSVEVLYATDCTAVHPAQIAIGLIPVMYNHRELSGGRGPQPTQFYYIYWHPLGVE